MDTVVPAPGLEWITTWPPTASIPDRIALRRPNRSVTSGDIPRPRSMTVTVNASLASAWMVASPTQIGRAHV